MYQTFPRTEVDDIVIETVYEDLPILERRAIEKRAEYLKAMLSRPETSWADFEKQYEIHPRDAFIIHTHWVTKRSRWLGELGLDYEPFNNYIKIVSTEADRQALEAAWALKSPDERQRVKEEGENIKNNTNPLFDSWAEFESVFGYAGDTEKHFKYNHAGYKTNRLAWLAAIGMSVAPYTNSSNGYSAMDPDWKARGADLKKAQEERARFVRDKHREEEAKVSGNYKAPKKTGVQKTAGGRVSKYYSNNSRFGGGYYGGGSSSSGTYESGYNSRYRQNYGKRYFHQ